MTEFKVGDVVRCMDASQKGLTYNKIYTVISISRDRLIGVICDLKRPEEYFSRRFILEEEENE